MGRKEKRLLAGASAGLLCFAFALSAFAGSASSSETHTDTAHYCVRANDVSYTSAEVAEFSSVDAWLDDIVALSHFTVQTRNPDSTLNPDSATATGALWSQLKEQVACYYEPAKSVETTLELQVYLDDTAVGSESVLVPTPTTAVESIGELEGEGTEDGASSDGGADTDVSTYTLVAADGVARTTQRFVLFSVIVIPSEPVPTATTKVTQPTETVQKPAPTEVAQVTAEITAAPQQVVAATPAPTAIPTHKPMMTTKPLKATASPTVKPTATATAEVTATPQAATEAPAQTEMPISTPETTVAPLPEKPEEGGLSPFGVACAALSVVAVAGFGVSIGSDLRVLKWYKNREQ